MILETIWCLETSDNVWSPLWRRDSEKLEHMYQRNERDGSINIQNTHYTVHLAARVARRNYTDDDKPKRLIRGTWFWQNSLNKSIPFEEVTASEIEAWYRSLLDDAEQLAIMPSFRSEMNIGEAMGQGKGQYKVIAVKQPENEKNKSKSVTPTPTPAPAPVSSSLSLSSSQPPWETSHEITKNESDHIKQAMSLLDSHLSLSVVKTSDFIPSSCTIRRGLEWSESPDEILGDYEVDHLCLVVHGIGEALFSKDDNPLPSFRASVEKCRLLTLQQRVQLYEKQLKVDIASQSQSRPHPTSSSTSSSTSASTCPTGPSSSRLNVSRVEFIPVEWHACVHSEELALSNSIKNVTLNNIPLLRDFANEAILDVLLYLSPHFQNRIIREVCRKLNQVYLEFCCNNPGFSGKCSIVGHSLGTVITFDLLMKQNITPTHLSTTNQSLSNHNNNSNNNNVQSNQLSVPSVPSAPPFPSSMLLDIPIAIPVSDSDTDTMSGHEQSAIMTTNYTSVDTHTTSLSRAIIETGTNEREREREKEKRKREQLEGKKESKRRKREKGSVGKELRRLQKQSGDVTLTSFPTGVQLNQVLLVGGATRMPLIRRLVRTITGIDPRYTVDPDLAVGLGAAVYTGIMDNTLGERDMTVMSAWQSALYKAFYQEQLQREKEKEREREDEREEETLRERERNIKDVTRKKSGLFKSRAK